MRIISKPIDISVQDELLQGIAPLSDFLLLDIETTGLSAENSLVYLIGCIYHQTDGWNMIQWMDNSGKEEKEVLSSFLLFASGYKIFLICPVLFAPGSLHLAEEKIPAGAVEGIRRWINRERIPTIPGQVDDLAETVRKARVLFLFRHVFTFLLSICFCALARRRRKVIK